MIALFNARDRWRGYFDARVEAIGDARLITTLPCVTEAPYMLKVLANRIDLMRWLAAGGARVVELPAAAFLQMAGWMERYSERREMDFADASLMWLAIDAGTRQILTTDRNDFERYRLPGNKRFEIL